MVRDTSHSRAPCRTDNTLRMVVDAGELYDYFLRVFVHFPFSVDGNVVDCLCFDRRWSRGVTYRRITRHHNQHLLALDLEDILRVVMGSYGI